MRLEKEFTLIDVFSLASAAMISSGIFVLPGLAYAKAGPAVIISYLLAAIFILPALFSKAELITAMPRAGGTYFYLDRSIGPAAGTIGGIASWLALSLKSAFALFGIGAVLTFFTGISELEVKIIASACCIIMIVMNLKGTHHTKATKWVILGLIGILVLYAARGLSMIHPERYTPFFEKGAESIFYAAGLVFISYAGFTKVTSVASEIKDPNRNIPMGMFLAFGIVTVLYALVTFVTVGLVDGKVLAGSIIPISEGARGMGNVAVYIMAGAAVLSFVTTGDSGMAAAARIPMAMSRDGKLPEFLMVLDPHFRKPYNSIFLTGAFMISAIMLLDLRLLAKTASIMQIVIFMFAIVSVIVMRESKLHNYQPKYRSPLYPYIHIAGILGYGIILSTMGRLPLIIAFVMFGLGLILYIYNAHRKSHDHRGTALDRVLMRMSDSEVKPYQERSVMLNRELKEIIHERDEIVEDKFDHLVKESRFIEIVEKMKYEEIFKIAALLLARPLGVEKEQLLERLLEREKEAPTAYRPGVAITHLRLEEDCPLVMLAARCKKGVRYYDSLEPVKAVFILIGSNRDEKLYLHSTAALSAITMDADFEEKWMNAHSAEELHDIVHIGRRNLFRTLDECGEPDENFDE